VKETRNKNRESVNCNRAFRPQKNVIKVEIFINVSGSKFRAVRKENVMNFAPALQLIP
jgi:hypothetical protein